jgi:zinc transporter ZupT
MTAIHDPLVPEGVSNLPPDTDFPTGPHRRPGRRRVGSIVAGSLIAGFVAAAGLVAAPFVGTRENAVTGAVLLGFALGWALLAALSTRWSDQPQRWAFVPAVFIAVSGGVLIAGSETMVPGVLDWVWPPALVALVAWMITRARRQLHSPRPPMAPCVRLFRMSGTTIKLAPPHGPKDGVGPPVGARR